MARAKTAANAILYYEAGQEFSAMAALTDSGDHKTFTSGDEYWSGYEGREPVVRPDGLVTGGVISEASSGTSDVVDVSAATAYLAGVLTSVSAAADEAVARPSAYLSITLAASGYTDCVASDIGKTVTQATTSDTGELIAYNNTTREWIIDPDAPEDTFSNASAALTIGTGTGAGDGDGAAVAVTHKICSVTINSSGAIAVVEGYEGTSFSSTRGDVGGPPFIPVGSVEIGQVRYTAQASAAVDEDEIFQVPGTHLERYDHPLWDEDWEEGEVTFVSALSAIHTAGVPKAVYAEYYTPVFAEQANASDFVPAETSHSVSSTQVYGGTVGASSSSLGQGSFNVRLNSGVTDNLLKLKNKTLWFKFLPDRYKDELVATQGVLGVSRQYPAGDSIQASCTISASVASSDRES